MFRREIAESHWIPLKLLACEQHQSKRRSMGRRETTVYISLSILNTAVRFVAEGKVICCSDVTGISVDLFGRNNFAEHLFHTD